MEHTKLTPIESLSHYFTKNRKKISLPNLFFSNTIVFEQLQNPPETPNTEETSVSVAYNSMENTNSEQSSLSPNKSSISPTKTHDEVIDDLEIEHDQNLDMLLPIDEAPEIQLNGELFNEENCDIIDEQDNLEEEETENGKKLKTRLQKEVFFFLVQLFARGILLMKKLEIEETKTTYSNFKTDIIKVGLVFSISNFFIKKSSLANKWMSFSYSSSTLEQDI